MQATAVDRFDQPASVQTGIGFEDYLRNWILFIRNEQLYARDLTQACVTVHIRSRGVTVSDMVSAYGTRPETRGQWIQYDPNLDGEVHPLNIVGPSIRTNKNACLQSNSQTEVTSANESAKHKQIAMKWQRFADYFERTGWNEEKRAFIFDDVQKGGTDLVETTAEVRESQSVTSFDRTEVGMALYQCPSCEASGMQRVPLDENTPNHGQITMPCPECSEEALAVVKPLQGFKGQEQEISVRDIDDQIHSFLNFAIDLYGAKTKGLDGAGWVTTYCLRELNYMLDRYPGRSFTGPGLWSYQSQADYALSRGRWDYLNRRPIQNGFGLGHERYEEQVVYLHEEAYSSYRSPSDYECPIRDANGSCTFKIKAGQTIGEAQAEMFGENYHGFKFIWCEDQLLAIPNAKDEEVNLRYRFADVHWNRESGAYMSSPNFSTVYLQDDITQLNTKQHNIIARNDTIPVWYNSLVFDKADFSSEFIGSSKMALTDPATFDVRKHIASLPTPIPSPAVAEQLQFLWSIKDEQTQVTSAMRGESRAGDPGIKARQDLEQSYGNLTSVLKSFARCKCRTFLNKARAAKRWYTLEQFQAVGSMFGEVWTEQDVREMCDIDLERDLVVSYREGSEIPSTPISKEMKFFGALQQLTPFLQAFPQLVGPDKMTKILQKIDEVGGFDFDLTGLEVNELIAQKRYIDLSKLCEPMSKITPQQIEQARGTQVGTEPATPEQIQQSIQMAQQAPDDPQVLAQAQQLAAGTPVSALDVMVESIFHKANIRFSQYEDIKQQISFFTECLRSEIGKTQPNYMLIEVMEVVLGMADKAQQHIQAQEIAKDPQAQAAAAADEAAKADKQAELQLEAESVKTARMKVEGELQSKAADRELKVEEIKAGLVGDMIAQAADHEHEAGMVAAEPGEEAAVPTAVKVSESIAYKDAPPSIRRQMEQQAGMKPATSEENKVEMAAKKEEAKPKPVPVAKPAAKPATKKK